MAGPRGTNSPSEQHYNLTESPARTPIRARWWEVTAAQVALVPFYTPRTAEPLGPNNLPLAERERSGVSPAPSPVPAPPLEQVSYTPPMAARPGHNQAV